MIDRKQDAPSDAGVIEVVGSEPCEFKYDNDGAVICCIEGSFQLKEGKVKTEVKASYVVCRTYEEAVLRG